MMNAGFFARSMIAAHFANLPLPTRDGVGPSCVALPPGPWATMTDFLVERFPAVSRAVWLARMQAHELLDEHGAQVTPSRAYEARLRLYYYRDARAIDVEPVIPFEEVLLYRDEHLLVVDKPHFLPVTPGGRYLQQCLLVRLKRRLGIDTLVPIHRIDRETAGLVLFSLLPRTRGAYQQLFAERRIEKKYEAVVHWPGGIVLPARHCSRLVADTRFMRMREVEGLANSQTRFDLLDARGDRALLALAPVTGRKHQLRVHCAALGIPIEGDRIYPQLMPEGSDDFSRPMQLLAKSLAFIDPVSGEARRFSSARKLDWPAADASSGNLE